MSRVPFRNSSEGYAWFNHTEHPTRLEAIAYVAFIGSLLFFDLLSGFASETGFDHYRQLSIAATLTLLLMLWSPLVGTLALSTVVGLSFALGDPQAVILSSAVATLFVTRLASTPLLLIYMGGLLAVTAGLLMDGGVSATDIAVYIGTAVVSGATGVGVRRAVNRGHSLESRIARQAEEQRQAILDERRWIAGELHDSIAHHLTVVSLHSQLLDDPEMFPVSKEAIQNASRKALSDLRFVINLAEDSSMSEQAATGDLAAAIAEAVSEFEEAGHTTVLVGNPRDELIPRGAEIILARTVRESATNILKYAGPGEVRFTLEPRSDAVSLEIRSPLSDSGPRVDSSSGTGLSRMSERALNLRGEFRAGPEGKNWVVYTRLPIVGQRQDTRPVAE